MVSLCVPTSAIGPSNCHNLDQITHTAYQIAKAACTFQVDEIVVLQVPETPGDEKSQRILFDESQPSKGKVRPDSLLLLSLLQYFVTPPYLVKSVFGGKVDKNSFNVAKKLPKVSTLPFMQVELHSKYREGMSIDRAVKRKKTASGKVKKIKKSQQVTKYVNVGTDKPLELKQEIPINARVTVDMKTGEIVSPLQAYGSQGTNGSFGYSVRVATDLTKLFTESGYPEGYESTIFADSGDYFGDEGEYSKLDLVSAVVGKTLLVVAPWKDIQTTFSASGMDVGSATELFDGRLDIPCKSRVEDGCMIALAMTSDK